MVDFAIADVAIAIAAVVLITVAISLWRFFREWAKTLEHGRFVEMVEAAVAYAEQVMRGKEGQEKLEQVMAQLQAAFPNFDVSFIRVFVERYVHSMKEQEAYKKAKEEMKGE